MTSHSNIHYLDKFNMEGEADGQEIAELLKAFCRHENGFYVEDDTDESSVLMLQLSQHYFNLRHQEKRNYLYAAGLLAAAKLRSPDDDAIDGFMEELWRELMLEADATERNVKLVPIATELKERVAAMRETAKKKMEDFPKVEDGDTKRSQETRKVEAAERVFRLISENYIEIMRFISDQCCKILFGNKTPCKFAHMTLGSLARHEGTPYSDFENAILIDNTDEEVKERFRFYIVLFQVMVLTLGETPLRLLGVPLLNDFDAKERDWFYDRVAKSGIQFDSNMPVAGVHPLSRAPTAEKPYSIELIRSPIEMAGLVERDESLPNNHHLADVLCQSRLVAGDTSLHEQYRNAIADKLCNMSNWCREQIKESMQLHDAIDELCTQVSRRNLKLLIYRGLSITISHLGNFFGTRSSSCFEIVDELVHIKGRLSVDTGHDLKYAIALAGEIRLKIYLETDQQVRDTDIVSRADGKRILGKVIEAVGEVAICDLFYVTHTLWRSLLSFVRENTDIVQLSYVREQVSQVMKLAIRSNLFGGLSNPQAVERFAETEDRFQLDKIGILQLARTTTNHLLDAFILLRDVLRRKNAFQTPVDMKENLIAKMKTVLKSFAICEEIYQNPGTESNSQFKVLANEFFAGQEKDRKMFYRIANDMQELSKLVFRDQNIYKAIPEIMLLLYLVADFVTTFIAVIGGYLHANDNNEEVLNDLGDIVKAMENFRSSLPAGKIEISESVGSVKLARRMEEEFDDGLFSENNVEAGIEKWLEKVKLVKNMVLLVEQIPIFDKKINEVLEHLLDIHDWSFIVPTYGKAIRRDAGILLADIWCWRGELLSRGKKFTQASEELQIGHQLLVNNAREKAWFYRKLAASMHNIGKNLYFCDNYSEALIWFRRELDYRLRELPKRTNNEQFASIYHYLAECLRKVGTEESNKEADMFAECEFELMFHVEDF